MRNVLFFALMLCVADFLSAENKDSESVPFAYHKHVEEMLKQFGRRIAGQNGMKFLSKGCGTVVKSKLVAWDLSLVSPKNLTLEEGRGLIVCMIHDFYEFVKKDPAFGLTLDDNVKCTLKRGEPYITPKRIGIKLAFWDKDVNRPLFPYLAQIKVLDERIEYYYADPSDQSLQKPIVESFEEAFAKAFAQGNNQGF